MKPPAPLPLATPRPRRRPHRYTMRQPHRHAGRKVKRCLDRRRRMGEGGAAAGALG